MALSRDEPWPRIEITPQAPITRELFETAREIRSSRISDYLAGLGSGEREGALDWADEFYAQGGFLADFVAITPVAAHQERPETIKTALAQYAQQVEPGPFTIILGLNYPSSESDNPLIEANRAAITETQETFPGLDVRTVEVTYDEFVIGGVRRDLWNAALALDDRRNQALGYRDTLGMTHDIDLVTMSPHFIQTARAFHHRIIRRYPALIDEYADGTSRPFYTRSKHAYDPRFPNIGRATLWSDALSRKVGSSFEAGTCIPFMYYATVGGYDAAKALGETHELFGRGGDYWPEFIDGTGLDSVYTETSNRRYVERLQKGTLGDIWPEGGFTNADAYRTSVDDFEDIPKAFLKEMIIHSMVSATEKLMDRSLRFALYGPLSEDSPEKAALMTKRDLLFIERLIGQTMDLPELTYFLKRTFEERAEQMRKINARRTK